MFDSWLTCEGPALGDISRRVSLELLEATSKSTAQRVRNRKADVVQRHNAIVGCLVANLKLLHYGEPNGTFLAVPMKHLSPTRYDRPGFKMLPDVVDAMVAAGMVVKRQARIKVARTGIKATGWLLQTLKQPNAPLADIGRADGEEVIWLSARMGRDDRGDKISSQLLPYEDTVQTHRLRGEMETINAFLAEQKVALDREL